MLGVYIILSNICISDLKMISIARSQLDYSVYFLISIYDILKDVRNKIYSRMKWNLFLISKSTHI